MEDLGIGKCRIRYIRDGEGFRMYLNRGDGVARQRVVYPWGTGLVCRSERWVF